MQNPKEITNEVLTSAPFIEEAKKQNILGILSSLNRFFNEKATQATEHLKFEPVKKDSNSHPLDIQRDVTYFKPKKSEPLTDNELKEILERYPSLLSIDLSWCRNITDIPLTHFESLKSINLEGCYELKSIAFPENLNTLQYISFKECASIEEIFFEGDFELVENLNLDCCVLVREFTFFESLPNLRHIDLTGCNLFEKGVEVLSKLCNLQSMILKECENIDHSHLTEVLPALKHLEELVLPEGRAFTSNTEILDWCKEQRNSPNFI